MYAAQKAPLLVSFLHDLLYFRRLHSLKCRCGKTSVSNVHAVAHTTAGAPPAASAHLNWIYPVSERIQAPEAGSRMLRSRTCWLRIRGMDLSWAACGVRRRRGH